MFYVQRDAQGELIRVEAAAYAEATETLPADHHEIQAWYANEAVENSLKQLKQSDFEMIRVLDDLIQVLTQKGVIRVTDLPAAALQPARPASSRRPSSCKRRRRARCSGRAARREGSAPSRPRSFHTPCYQKKDLNSQT